MPWYRSIRSNSEDIEDELKILNKRQTILDNQLLYMKVGIKLEDFDCLSAFQYFHREVEQDFYNNYPSLFGMLISSNPLKPRFIHWRHNNRTLVSNELFRINYSNEQEFKDGYKKNFSFIGDNNMPAAIKYLKSKSEAEGEMVLPWTEGLFRYKADEIEAIVVNKDDPESCRGGLKFAKGIEEILAGNNGKSIKFRYYDQNTLSFIKIDRKRVKEVAELPDIISENDKNYLKMKEQQAHLKMKEQQAQRQKAATLVGFIIIYMIYNIKGKTNHISNLTQANHNNGNNQAEKSNDKSEHTKASEVKKQGSADIKETYKDVNNSQYMINQATKGKSQFTKPGFNSNGVNQIAPPAGNNKVAKSSGSDQRPIDNNSQHSKINHIDITKVKSTYVGCSKNSQFIQSQSTNNINSVSKGINCKNQLVNTSDSNLNSGHKNSISHGVVSRPAAYTQQPSKHIGSTKHGFNNKQNQVEINNKPKPIRVMDVSKRPDFRHPVAHPKPMNISMSTSSIQHRQDNSMKVDFSLASRTNDQAQRTSISTSAKGSEFKPATYPPIIQHNQKLKGKELSSAPNHHYMQPTSKHVDSTKPGFTTNEVNPASRKYNTVTNINGGRQPTDMGNQQQQRKTVNTVPIIKVGTVHPEQPINSNIGVSDSIGPNTSYIQKNANNTQSGVKRITNPTIRVDNQAYSSVTQQQERTPSNDETRCIKAPGREPQSHVKVRTTGEQQTHVSRYEQSKGSNSNNNGRSR